MQTLQYSSGYISIPTLSSCYLSCIANVNFSSLPYRCKVNLAGDWSVDCPRLLSLLSGHWGGGFPLFPFCLTVTVRTTPAARAWSTQVFFTHIVWISTAHLLTEESAAVLYTAVAKDIPSTNRSPSAHTARSSWCCHNGNEMNCKLQHTFQKLTFVVALKDGDIFNFTFMLE